MSDEDARAAMIARTVDYALPGTDDVVVRRGVPIEAAHGPVVIDIYTPGDLQPGERRPAVLIAIGFPTADLGRSLKDIGAYRSWGRLIAASGAIAITHAGGAPVDDLRAVAAALGPANPFGVDPDRLALWACSGNSPTGLALLAQTHVRAAALLYPYTIDLDGHAEVATAAARFGCAPPPPFPLATLRAVPLLIVRAGADEMPGLNPSLDRFIGAVLAADLPIAITNVAGAPHGFDLYPHTPASRAAIAQVLAFLLAHLR